VEITQIFFGAIRDRVMSEKGRADGVPSWSLASAVTKPDGGFVIIY
jgi:hypothetical protein